MRVFVVGYRGQLGHELMRARWPAGTLVEGSDLPEIDLAAEDEATIEAKLGAVDAIVNAAAYTAVDRAESERELAFQVNAEGPRKLARIAARKSVPIIHVSTDYVFDGSKRGPYEEDDAIAPLGAYGASKAEGERAVREAHAAHVILRTSWVYAAHGANFVRTMIRLARERDVLTVVADQQGRPTAAGELARAIVGVLARPTFGTFHFAGAGSTSWHGLATEVVARAERYLGRRPEVRPIETKDYPTPARRPVNSVLDTVKFERAYPELVLRPWRASVAEVVDELLAEEKVNS